MTSTGSWLVMPAALSSAYSTMGLPANGCRILGGFDFMRVPWPAARITIETFILMFSHPVFGIKRALPCVSGRKALGHFIAKSFPPVISKGKAGAPGFEPRSTDPKSGVLPLHYAPEFGSIINHNPSPFRKRRFHPLGLIFLSSAPFSCACSKVSRSGLPKSGLAPYRHYSKSRPHRSGSRFLACPAVSPVRHPYRQLWQSQQAFSHRFGTFAPR